MRRRQRIIWMGFLWLSIALIIALTACHPYGYRSYYGGYPSAYIDEHVHPYPHTYAERIALSNAKWAETGDPVLYNQRLMQRMDFQEDLDAALRRDRARRCE